METYSDVEHILLSSEQQEEEVQHRVTNLSFDQHSKWRRSEAHFTVFNEHYISIERQGLGEKPVGYEFDLSFLGSRPKRIRQIDWGPLVLALALIGAGITSAVTTLAAGNKLLVALLLVAGAVVLGIAVFRSHDRVIYFTKHGRAPLLVLINRNPNKAALQQFVADITRRIRDTRRNWSDRHDFLCAELKEHRRLHEQGVLDQSDYQRIKQRILRQHDPSRG